MAYATLSDPQKRTIYDRYGDEDPDNHGAGGMGAHFRRRGGGGGGPEMTPEEIFNAFFGGGMAGGMGPGMHFYSSGFGPGMQFRTAGGMPPRGRGQQQQQAVLDDAGEEVDRQCHSQRHDGGFQFVVMGAEQSIHDDNVG